MNGRVLYEIYVLQMESEGNPVYLWEDLGDRDRIAWSKFCRWLQSQHGLHK